MAQLGARFHGMEEVIGSIPIRSTNYPHPSKALQPRLSGATLLYPVITYIRNARNRQLVLVEMRYYVWDIQPLSSSPQTIFTPQRTFSDQAK